MRGGVSVSYRLSVAQFPPLVNGRIYDMKELLQTKQIPLVNDYIMAPGIAIDTRLLVNWPV